MELRNALSIVAGILIAWQSASALDIPGADGSDGAFRFESNYNYSVVFKDMALAKTGVWNEPGDGNGIYDPDKWVVVYKVTELVLRDTSGTSNFYLGPHPSGAPVMFLVSGDVNIASSAYFNVSGANPTTNTAAPGGPGGFAGGIGSNDVSLPKGAGFGPGGGLSNLNGPSEAGTHSSVGFKNYNDGPNSGRLYGNERALPLIGGSGGGSYNAYGGGGGGGAILIAAQGTITIDGVLLANGGKMTNASYIYQGNGAGGMVRLVAESIGGVGEVQALGGVNRENNSRSGDGWVRLEANSGFGDLLAQPLTNIVAPDAPVLLFPPDGSPEIKVVSIAGQAAPADPRGQVGAGTTDLVADGVDTGAIVVETRHVDLNAEIELHVVPKHGSKTIVPMDSSMAAGDRNFATWTVTDVILPQTFFSVQAYARNPEL